MNVLRSTLSLACLALLTTAAAAQAPARAGITDIMRAGPSVAVPAPAARPAPQVQRAAEYILALVNSEPITNTQVQRRMERVLEEAGQQAASIPRDVLMRDVLEQIISERAQLQLAKEMGIRVDQLSIDQGEEMVARQNQLSPDELKRRLAAGGISRDEFRNNIRDQLLLTRLRERELESRVRVSDREIDDYLAEQRLGTPAAGPAQLNIAQVLVGVPEKASEAEVARLQKQAEAIAARARAGEDFGKLASEFPGASDARGTGGAMGLRPADRYPSLFVEATQNLQVGGIAGPLRSGAGFHVLKLLARERGAASADATIQQTQARHILIRPDDKRTAEQIAAQMTDFKRRVQNGTADFAGLARDHSQDQGSAANGGDLGWTVPGTFVPEFEEALNRLQPGQISEPLVSRFGVHLIQVQGRREAKLDPRELRAAARNALRDRKMEQAYESWAQEVRHRAFVELRERPVP